MTTVSVKLPEQLLRQVEEAAAERGVPKSAIIRESLEISLRERASKKKPSCLDLMRDLVGTFDGPADASVNKRYLESAILADYKRGQKKRR
ncbi:hypothetical protein BH20VER2_BH20VER2_04060 [soil metagenome]